MASHNISSAYDLSMFEDAPKRELSPAELKVIKNRRPTVASTVLSPGVLCAFAIVISLVALMVYNRAQLTELTGEISRLTTQIAELESENIQLTSAIESAESNPNIRVLAIAMGMQKRDEYQTERIYLYNEDKIERTEASPQNTANDTAKLAVTSFFSRFKEYLSDR